MSSETALAIDAQGIGKCYALYDRPGDRLRQLVFGRWKKYHRDFWALRDVTFSVGKGEVIGVVGRNGAGKSTLLQMVCGTLAASTGALAVDGRVAALLELGAGFNPDFSGRENIYMNAAIMGLGRAEVDERLDDILAFADIGAFIDQPVKSYSSGMFMRLAFSVATSVDPDILVIDEALSVGDGAFARKSFDRIMRLKEAGKTILFCSHSMYQVEALCSRALWIDGGTIRMQGPAAEVTAMYGASLNANASRTGSEPAAIVAAAAGSRTGRILKVTAQVDGTPVETGVSPLLHSRTSDFAITLRFNIDPSLPVPAVAFGFSDMNGWTVCSASSHNDGVQLQTDAAGEGVAHLVFPRIPLLKGRYTIAAFLLTEDALHAYDFVERCLVVDVVQQGLDQGVVSIPHAWTP